MKTLAVVLAVLSLASVSCRSTSRPIQGQPVARGAAPAYAEVAAAYNARVETLERVWARTVVRMWYIDGDGNARGPEQVEGHCQYVRPSRVMVSFHKAGHPLALLGCNDDRFWWMELGDAKRAFVGSHRLVTPERIAAVGLRVHPLDLMELLALTALPPAGEGRSVAWSEDGRSLVVTVPSRMSRRRLVLDPETFRPSRVELLDEKGGVSAFADLGRYENVALKGAGPDIARPLVPTDVRFEADGGATRIIMQLSEPQNDPARFKPVAFDLERLLEAHDVREVHDLDREAPRVEGR